MEKFDKVGLLVVYFVVFYDVYMLERGLFFGFLLFDSEVLLIFFVYAEFLWKDFRFFFFVEMKVGKIYRKYVFEGCLCVKFFKVIFVVNVLEEDFGFVMKFILINVLFMRVSMV